MAWNQRRVVFREEWKSNWTELLKSHKSLVSLVNHTTALTRACHHTLVSKQSAIEMLQAILTLVSRCWERAWARVSERDRKLFICVAAPPSQQPTYRSVPTSTTAHMIPEVEMCVDTKCTHTADRCPGKVEWLLYPGGNTCRTCISSWQLEAYSQLLSYLQSALSHTNLYPSMSPQVSFLIRLLLFSQSTSLAPLTSVRLFYLAWQTETFLAIIPLQHHSQIETPILRVHLGSQQSLFH